MSTTKKADREKKLLQDALCELGNHAHREDVTQTAADLKLSVEHVRRFLRGTIHSVETGKQVYDYLRNLTLVRTHAIERSLQRA